MDYAPNVIELPLIESFPAFYVGVHPYSFRSGEHAEIIGVRMVRTKHSFRACFMLLYADGMIDYSAIEDEKNYILGKNAIAIP